MSALKQIALVTALILLVAFSPAAMQSNNWEKVAPAGGRFSVMMPAEPKDSEFTPAPDFTSHGYAEEIDGVIYVCLYGDYAASIHLNPDAELAANRDNFLKTLNASLILTKEIELDGRFGLEFTGETAENTFQGKVYILGNRIFQITVGVPKVTGDAGNAARFLKSFALTDSKEHEKP